MAGVKPPGFVDGRSFLPLLKGTTLELPKWRSAFLIEHKEDRKRQLALENQTERFQNQLELRDNKECPDRVEFPNQSELKEQSELEDQLELEDLSEFKSLQKKGQIPNFSNYEAIRTQDYTYVEYKNGAKELYNIKKDPYQLNNLASTADPTLLKQLAERLSKLHDL